MGQQIEDQRADPEQLRLFMKRLLTDLRALERMLEDGRIETGRRRIGAEQEVALVDEAWRPAPVAMDLLEDLKDDPRFTTELARFNLEFNLDPILWGGDCLSRLERDFRGALDRLEAAAAARGTRVVLTGILPTIRKSDLGLENMTPLPRYTALADALRQLRGGPYEFRFTGTDELLTRHDSVMLESCNTSTQFHFQVDAEEFARLYNISQAVAGPVLAAAVNSPLLFGRRLWSETRIAVFQQAIDTRQPGHALEARSARVHFGSRWVNDSVVEILREDVARFRVIMAQAIEEDPLAVLDAGGTPKLRALQLHNSTVYRWNRPCYGISDGKPHLRIENRVFPSGPTLADEVANAAFWFGLISGVFEQYNDITRHLDFDAARTNFLVAARLGLDTHLTWVDGRKTPAAELIRDTLVPLAREGLVTAGIDGADIDRYLGIIDARVARRRTGAQWQLDSFNALRGHGPPAEQLIAITAATWDRQQSGHPVHEWLPIQLSDAGDWARSLCRVEQYMTTDVFAVNEHEVIDLVASLMDWEHIRHVPVEDDAGRLVGLISYRQLLRLLAQDHPREETDPVAARDIMVRDPISIAPETPTLEAVDIMRRKHVPCLPVVKDGRIVGMVSERDFLGLAAGILESHLREIPGAQGGEADG